MQNVLAEPVPYEQAMAIIMGRATPAARAIEPLAASAATNGCGTTQPPEIVALASALKNNPDLIYEFVFDNIDTLPQYGSLKGALGALIDRSGTAFDQADLMVALLQQAGNCTGSFEVGQVVLTGAQLASWLGISLSQTNNQYGLGSIIGTGGFPGSYATNGSGQIVSAQIGWAWVQVQIGGTNYVFDPATLAKYNATRPPGLGTALPTAMGYSQSSFIASAESGATDTGVTIAGVNRANIRANLTAYAASLAASLKSNHPAFAPTDALGGRTIVPLPVNTQQRVTTLAYQAGTIANYPTLPPSLRTQVTLALPGGTPWTFDTSDVYGRRLSLSFSPSIVPTLNLDGVVEETGSAAASGAPVTVTLGIHHPYAIAPVASCSGINITGCTALHVTASANAVFAIGNGWGQVSRNMIERHRRLLQQAIAAYPGNLNAEPVLGESLTMLGLTWLAQNARVEQLTDAFAGTSTIYQHALGIVGLAPVGGSTGPFVDLPVNVLGILQINGRPSGNTLSPVESAAFFAVAGMSSVLESGSIEQTQPGVSAASTVKVLDNWGQSPTSLFYNINDSTVTGVTDDCAYYVANIRAQLLANGYSTAPGGGDIGRIDSLVGYNSNTGLCPSGGSFGSNYQRVIAPLNGHNQIGQWFGTGYFQITQDGRGVGAIITGGLSGGYPGTPDPTPAPQAVVSQMPSTNSLTLPNSAQTTGQAGDPLNQVTGAYQFSHDDITVGSLPFPYGLGFQRSYDSSRAGKTPLGTGWMSNFSLSAQTASDGFEGMAATSPQNGAAAIASLYVLQDILNAQTGTAKPLDRMIVAVEIERFLMDTLTDNVIQVVQPGLTESYVLLPNGVYLPPIGTATLVTQANGTVTYRTKDGSTLTFDNSGGTTYPAGNLKSWSNPAGVAVTFGYTGGLLTSVGNNAGRSLALAYNASQQLGTVSDGNGRSVGYGYTGNNLTTFTDPLGQTTTFAYDTSGTYDAAGHLTQIFYLSHPANAFVSSFYNPLGQVYKQANAAGDLTLAYFAGSRTEIDNPVGNAQISYFDPLGRTLLALDGLGNKTVSSYDGQERLLTRTLPESNSFAYTYDADSNVLAELQTPKIGSGLTPRTRSWTYDPTYNKVLTATDFAGNVTTYGYDAAGNLASVTQPAVTKPGVGGTHQPVTSFTSNGLGLRTAMTDAEGRVTAYSYDAAADLATVTVDQGSGHLNLLTQYNYDPIGGLFSLTDPNGNQTAYVHDAARRLTLIEPPSPFNNNLTEYGYDPDGRQVCVQRAVGGAGSAPCTGSTGATWQTTTATYTLTGNLATTKDASGGTTSYAYDGADRLASVTDAVGRTTYYAYDADNRVDYIWRGGTAPANAWELRWYVANGGLGRRDYFNQTGEFYTYYATDGFDRPSVVWLPDGTNQQAYYSVNDDLTDRYSRAGQHVSWSYDALHRALSKTGAPNVAYGYDYTGRLLSAATVVVPGDPSTGTWSFSYDSAGRKSQDASPDGLTVGYGYDADGNRDLIYYKDGTLMQPVFDQLDRQAGANWVAHTNLFSFAFDPLDRASALYYPENGVGTFYSYAGTSTDVTQVANVLGTSPTQTYDYGYNATHQVVSQAVTAVGLLAHPAAAAAIAYDPPSSTNQLPGIAGGAGFSYDADGNLLSDGVRSYTYDAEGAGRILTATAAGATASYRYDPFNRRYSKTAAGVTTIYLHDDQGHEIAEYDGGFNLQRYLVYGQHQLAPMAAVSSAGTISFAHVDQQGSVVAQSSGGTVVAGPFAYLPYGESAVPSTFGFGYAGYRYDAETGLYHTADRYYDPRLGRFTTPDPIGQDGGLNLYAYVDNDPLNATDPSGLATYFVQAGGSLVGILGGLFSGGYYITTNGPYGLPDIGVFRVAGPAVGANVGVGVSIGYANGTSADFRGRVLNIDAGVGPVTGSVTFTPTGSKTFNNVVGASIGLGLSPTVVGADLSSTTTKAAGLLEDLILPAFGLSPSPQAAAQTGGNPGVPSLTTPNAAPAPQKMK